MARPTVEGLAHTTDCLESLAWRCTTNNDNGYHRLAELADFLLWLDTEIETQRKASVWPPGTDEAHTIGRHGLNRPTESRLEWGSEEGKRQRGGTAQPPVEPNDRVYRNLRKLQQRVLEELGPKIIQWQNQGVEAGGWPHRTQEATG